ncbi:Rab-GTPase-TBC domain and Pleckstrin domain and Pleckstrin domain-containing protein [Trichostrongylus colubriformis]|uniref:Rab-GTPase-TBC domain and Pleckstrin domain and Pleckstrin domain-containing protein n=1 Tax=Trichostrongylus colubriformis TaxID=6319 RepID=A0AAN8ITN6_TRICO
MAVRAFSLAGHLHMKTVGALSILRSKKQYYFAIDELNSQLLYYKEEADLVAKREPVGVLPLANAAFTILEGNDRTFVLHSGEKVVELEAPNPESCECWLEALSHRALSSQRKRRRLRSPKTRKERKKCPSESDYGPVEECNLVPPLTGRKYSCSPSHVSSDMALSVLEKKFNDLEPIARSHSSGIEDGSTDRVLSELADGNLDEWVSKWLEQQKFSGDDQRTDSLHSSTATSPYRSAEGSTTGSERASNEELHHLRFISNQQKKRIHELIREKTMLRDQAMAFRQRSVDNPTDARDTVVSQNRFLNSEIIRLNRQCCEMQEDITRLTQELRDAREVIDRSRREYVFALQSAIRIPLHDNNALDVMHVKLLGGDMHKHRICQLMSEARANQPSLPTLQSLLNGVYVDMFGFRHKYTDESLAIHYMAMQLHEYYQSRLDSYFEHKRRWKAFLAANETIPITRETRALVRGGIPSSLRATVWRFLIHQRISDKKELYGRHYFRNLCSLQGGERDSMFCASHQKQINLDLLRTMPNNVHFMSANCKGVSQLQQVLRAFCLHNTSLGYCQGMNFLASTALLFIGPEDAFWFLVAMTENFHDKSYFDDNLAGAQADQEVLKELLEEHFPLIAAHLNSLDIDLATITLNWFLALFFDAVPFNTLLRIWDCFLLEGPMVLFRFALALLGLNQDEILARGDTIGIMKVIKAAVRLTYDVEGFFKLAFEELGELPSRNILRSKQLGYLEQLNQKLSQRQQIRSIQSLTGSESSEGCNFSISDVFFSQFDSSICYVIAGNQNHGHIGVITIQDGKAAMNLMDTEFDCRVCSFVLVREDMAFAGLISGYIIALHLQDVEGYILWELKLPDAPLRLHCADGRLFAALANGTLTVLENITEWSPTCLELLHIPLGPAPLVDVLSDGGEICIATACRLVRVDASTLTTVSTTYVACSSAGGSTPFFDKISCLAASPMGIFLCTANSTLLQLWSHGDCQLLFDVAFDHLRRQAGRYFYTI